MPDGPNPSTDARIANTTLRLLFERGVRGVTGQAVADAAGVSRMTVHRYCPSKEELLRSALGVIARVFQEAVEAPGGDGFDTTVARLGEAIARLPAGDLPTRLAEVREAYPGIHAEFLAARRRGIDGLLDRVLQDAQASGRLRADLDRRVVDFFVRESIANLFTPNPAWLAQGLRPTDLFRTVKEILLHGLVEQRAARRPKKRIGKGVRK